MNRSLPATAATDRAAFTLVELLVVITIIGILAGLLFPVLGVIRARAWETRTRDTAIQLSRAWVMHFQEFRAYPNELIETLPGVRTVEGDMLFPMTREAGNLLNWYQGSRDRYLALLTEVGARINDPSRPMRATATGGSHLPERFFERSDLQWRYGVMNAWGERAARRPGFSPADAEAYRFWVKLDTNYDGRITHEDRMIHRSAIAWAPNERTRDRPIRSW